MFSVSNYCSFQCFSLKENLLRIYDMQSPVLEPWDVFFQRLEKWLLASKVLQSGWEVGITCDGTRQKEMPDLETKHHGNTEEVTLARLGLRRFYEETRVWTHPWRMSGISVGEEVGVRNGFLNWGGAGAKTEQWKRAYKPRLLFSGICSNRLLDWSPACPHSTPYSSSHHH